jgi:hypothetical protein
VSVVLAPAATCGEPVCGLAPLAGSAKARLPQRLGARATAMRDPGFHAQMAAETVRHFCPFLNQRFFCWRFRSALLVE